MASVYGEIGMNHMDSRTSQAIALKVLVWILQNDNRAERLIAVTGITPADMRASLNEAWLLSAALSYLESYEPDLMQCAKDIEISPEQLVEAAALLAQNSG